MYDNSENLKICKDASLFCHQDPNPCCRYKSNDEKRCGNYECFYWNENYWSWSKPGLAKYVFVMLVQFIIQFAILILIETSLFRKIKYFFKKTKSVSVSRFTLDEDSKSNVIMEEEKIEKMIEEKQQKNFLVSKLYKNYSKLCAVNGISFSVEKNECFGLLGNT